MKQMLIRFIDGTTEVLFAKEMFVAIDTGYLTFYGDAAGKHPVFHSKNIIISMRSVTKKQVKEYNEAIEKENEAHTHQHEDHTHSSGFNISDVINASKEVQENKEVIPTQVPQGESQ